MIYPSLREGLIGAWAPILGSTGNIVPDHSGFGALGTLQNNPQWTIVNGIPCLQFSRGSDTYVECPRNDDGWLGALTVMAMVRPTNFATFNAVLYKTAVNGTNNTPIGMRVNSGGNRPLFTARGPSANYRHWQGGDFGTTPVWRTVAASFADGDVETVPIHYVDAEAITPTPAGGAGTGQVTGLDSDVIIGRRPDGAVEMEGGIAWAYVWSRALDPSEIALLHHTNGMALFEALDPIYASVPAVSAFVPHVMVY